MVGRFFRSAGVPPAVFQHLGTCQNRRRGAGATKSPGISEFVLARGGTSPASAARAACSVGWGDTPQTGEADRPAGQSSLHARREMPREMQSILAASAYRG